MDVRSAEAGRRFSAQIQIWSRRLGLLMLASVFGLWPQGARAQSDTPMRTEVASPSRVAALYAQLPLSFETNQGQSDPKVKYLAHGQGYTLWLTADQAVLALRSSNQPSSRLPVLHLKLVGSNPAPSVQGEQLLPGQSNYFLGNNPEAWHTGIATFAQVRYRNVYRDVDLVYYGHQGELEYDFEVAAGADPRRIRLGLEGAERLQLTPRGDLLLRVAAGEVRLQRPVAYQRVGQEWHRVAVRYVLGQGRSDLRARARQVGAGSPRSQEVGFAVGRYDRRQPLVIDPVLSYATYLGGTGGDVAYGIAVDSSDNAYVTGQTFSTDFPTACTTSTSTTCTAFQSSNNSSAVPPGNVFVTKLNSSGSSSNSGLVYSTYLGGKGTDAGYGIAVFDGDAFITGSTTSSDFPVMPAATATPPAFQTTFGGSACSTPPCSNAFITQLNSTGSKLEYSSYLGGRGPDVGQAVAVDSTGNAYVTGSTQSSDFPITTGAFQTTYGGGGDAFMAKVNFAGTELTYSTYLGGSGADVGEGIQVDSSGNAYVAGFTFSTDFPTLNPYQKSNNGAPNAFVAELNPEGSALVFSTYLGGTADDRAFGIALDASGGIYVTGASLSADFPTTTGSFRTANAGGGDAFATKFKPGGAGLSYSTFIGGSGADQGKGIAVDSSGEAFVTGFTQSSDFPTLDAVQSLIDLGLASSCKGNLCPDAFVTKLNASGNALVYSTYLGGSGTDYGQAIALDSTGDPYVAGSTFSTNFPAIAGAYQAVLKATAGNAFVAKIDVANSPNIAVVPGELSFGNQELSVPSATQTITVINEGTAPLTITGISIGCPNLAAGQVCDSPDFSETNTCEGTLNAGGSLCTMNVTFTPTCPSTTPAGTAPCAETAAISITDNAANSPQSFTLTGMGVTAGTSVTLAPTSLAFSNPAPGTGGGYTVGTVSSSQNCLSATSTTIPCSVTITNSGTLTLTITSISASGDFHQTNICTGPPLNGLLIPGASCSATVTFAPTATGARSGALSISDNAAGSPQAVALSGIGNAQFSLTSSSPTTAIVVGTTSVNIPISAPASSFSGTITPSCSISGQTCTFNPTTITAGQTTTLTVSNLTAATPNPFNFTVNGVSGSQTATLSLTILLQDYTLSATPLLESVQAGSPAGPYTIIVTPLNGFKQQVNLSCTGQPSGSTCSFSSSGVTPNGTSPASVMLTIFTTLTSSWPRGSLPGPTRKLPIYVLIVLVGLAALWRFRRLREWSPAPTGGGLRRWLSLPTLAAALVLALLLLEGGCRGTVTPIGTATGSFTITISGALNSDPTGVIRTTIINLAVSCPPTATCP